METLVKHGSLHSTMFLLILCDCLKITNAPTFFTFHYVSINTFKSFKRYMGFINFTFHYVSINTVCQMNKKTRL